MFERVIVYPVSKDYTHKVIPSIKSFMVNSDVTKIILLTEMDEYPEYLPECVEIMNVSEQRYFPYSGMNIRRSHHAYLCMMRLAFAEFLPYGRVLSLDADTLAMKDIGVEPWEMDLQGCHYAGAPETKISNQRRRPYANAGVLMFDLDRIRDDELAPVMIDAINNYSYQWLEQDCLHDHLRLMPVGSEWNACQFTDPCCDPKIRHFAYDFRWEYDDGYITYNNISWQVVEQRWRERMEK